MRMMETNKKNILVIENQQYEFSNVIKFLNNYNVYPGIDCFERFMNNVHVALNKKYDNEYRKLALKQIENIVMGEGDPFGNGKPADLILMDHILGGAHYCHTGIDLANYLNSERTENLIPVVFLSRTPQHDKEKLQGMFEKNDMFNLLNSPNRMGYEQNYKSKYANLCDWVHKGYFGDDCLDETYFYNYVISAIDRVLPLSEKSKLISKIDSIISQPYYVPKEIKFQLAFIRQQLWEKEKMIENFQISIMGYDQKNPMTQDLTEIINNAYNEYQKRL